MLPYIQYVMCNEQRLEMEGLKDEERKILSQWREAGHIEGGVSGLAITQEFWNIVCELVFLGYVDLYDE